MNLKKYFNKNWMIGLAIVLSLFLFYTYLNSPSRAIGVGWLAGLALSGTVVAIILIVFGYYMMLYIPLAPIKVAGLIMMAVGVLMLLGGSVAVLAFMNSNPTYAVGIGLAILTLLYFKYRPQPQYQQQVYQ